MKLPALLAIAALVITAATHAEEPKATPEEMKVVRTVDAYSENIDADFKKNEGKIVRLRFSVRSKEGKKIEGGSIETLTYANVKGSTPMGGSVTVTFPTAAEAWLAKLPTSYNKSRVPDSFVYARITSAKDKTATALGAKLINGAKGQELAW